MHRICTEASLLRLCLRTAPLLFLLLLAACKGDSRTDAAQKAAPPPEVSVLTVSTQDLPVTFEFVGQTAGSREVEVRARVGGILLRRHYEEGRWVKQGTVLFTLDPAPLQAALAKAQGALAQEEAQLTQASQDLARFRSLLQDGAISQQAYDQARAAQQAAEARVQSARAAVTEARLGLGYTTVEAPISGVTGRAEKSEGTLVVAGTDLLTRIAQVEPIYVNFSYSEQDLLRGRSEVAAGRLVLPPNDELQVELRLADGSAYPQTGRLNFNDLRVRAGTGTIEARAVFPNPDRRLLPGQFARVLIKGAVRPSAIVVPQAAVLTGQDGKFVYLVREDGTVEARRIETGEWRQQDFLVTSGLQAGDRVVVSGVSRLQPGMVVKAVPVEPSRPAEVASGARPSTGGAP
ncbi:MAG: efflux RND transporter periplasmic adaptor subunit [Acidobacteria bacterium]|nr:MAG: efflux RND transporter periplasmic adaptor subunit [Acidobacteriota bacterium]